MSTNSWPQWKRWSVAALALGLVATLGFGQGATKDLQKKLDGIVERFDKTQKDFDKTFEDAKDDAEREALMEKRPGLEFVAEFKALATEAKGTEIAAKSWMKVATLAADFGEKDDVIGALDVLLADHVKSPELAALPSLISQRLGRVLGKEKTEAVLRTLIEKSPEKSVQAAALYSVASTILAQKKAKPERVAEARTMMERIQKDFAGIKSPRGQEYKAMAEALLFEMDNLQIGKTAPDFEVTDENGVKFKLSDYRGKVVVIDFWGNW